MKSKNLVWMRVPVTMKSARKLTELHKLTKGHTSLEAVAGAVVKIGIGAVTCDSEETRLGYLFEAMPPHSMIHRAHKAA